MRRSPAWLSLALTLVLVVAAGCVELNQQVVGDGGGNGQTDAGGGGADLAAEDVPSGGEDAPAGEVAAGEVAGGDVPCPGEPPDCNAFGVCVVLGDEVVPTCEGGAWVCDTTGVADYEVVEASCDALDNDCDGETDEGLGARTDAATLTAAGCRSGGPCAAGVFAVCVDADWVCVYEGVAGYETVEVSCDGADNDCDGHTDQTAAGAALVEPCGTDCGAGVRTCAGGAFGACDAPQPAAEVCDGLDNNCDGATDEGLTEPPAEFACPAEGVCADAVDPPVTCVSAGATPGWTCDFTGVTGWQESETECDELDNDCDGATDEDIAEPDDVATIGCETAGVCAFGVTAACGAGGWTCDYSGVLGYEEEDEVSCDGLDNDCDGDTDEDIPNAADPQSVGCPEAVGVCATDPGIRAVCQDGGWACVTRVPAEFEPGAEVTCDNKDNDCDGQTDEAIVTASGAALADCLDQGACQSGVFAVCLSGAFVCVYTGVEGFEAREVSCDDVDNDCDGATDTLPGGGPLQVTPAEAGCITAGVCASPVVAVSCAEGAWSCDYTPIATFEQTETLCDGLDNDCDGDTDEDLADVGAAGCKLDGLCDETNVVAACNGAGGYTCDYTAVAGYEGDAETSCNDEDDDCDGQTDEGLDGDPVAADCDLEGQCTAANVEASCAGAAGYACDYTGVPEWQAAEDRCDGLDNDCDGDTDEDLAGDPLTDETSTTDCVTDGVCGGGVPATCESGGWTCHYDQVAGYESPEASCDELDNNCDGTTDEGVCTGPGAECEGNEGCDSLACRTDLDGVGQFCAADQDNCVAQLEDLSIQQVDDGESRCTAADAAVECAAGAWGAPTDCAPETPFCLDEVDGACHLCQPDTTQCDGADVATCDATGDAYTTAACDAGKVCAGAATCYPTNTVMPTADAVGAAQAPAVAWQVFGTAGYWIVAWAEPGADGSQDVVFRRVNALDAAGQASAVLTERAGPAGSSPYAGDQVDPAVASYAGGFALGWTGLGAGGDGAGSGVFLRRMVAGGFSGDSANTTVSTTTAGDQAGLRLAAYAGGDGLGAVIAVFSGPQGVAFRRFPLATNSAAIDAMEQAVTAEATASAPDVAAIPTGAFAVVWQEETAAGVYDVLIRWFGTDGAALSDAVVVAADVAVGAATGAPLPRVAVLPDLGWFVVWAQDNGDQTGWEVRGQLYSSVEAPLGLPFTVADGTALVEDAPAVAADAGTSRFVVLYTDDAIDGAGTGVAAVGVTPDDPPVVGGPIQVNAAAAGDQAAPAATYGPAGAFVGVWETPDADGTGVLSRLQRIP